ncbi:hypothetical protein GCM10020358_05950 [Amorphoplanes nipponensis]|uniref:Uncharacterized protein n=1 Tax=Actinoplanes nipponensis TaxID=135950 RepID=A0A919JFT1_9ACTN|nr:hypothetical protein [Actinoplanes nipponensis]GIE50219.1 hypothetical protein Ani05nite_37530 [Actinoplanes nipponensis]
MLDVAGMYVAKGYIDRADFLAEWGTVYGRVWLACQPFLEVRLSGIATGRNPRVAVPACARAGDRRNAGTGRTPARRVR